MPEEARSVHDQSQETAYLTRLLDIFDNLGQDLENCSKLDDALATITHRALEFIPGAEFAAVSRGRDDRYETVAATGSVPPAVDRIQYELSSGPCVDAIREDAIFRIGDLGQDARWPEFGRRAVAETGIRSMLSVRMFLEDDDLVAGLNMYATHVDAFPAQAEREALLLSTHSALAITSARRGQTIANLERALASNRDIGTAVGILMAMHKITREQAFDLLRLASQHTHRRLADIALDVIETGTITVPSGR